MEIIRKYAVKSERLRGCIITEISKQLENDTTANSSAHCDKLKIVKKNKN